MSWLLHRIDDRLIHGQVLVAWGARLNPARMWLVDDIVAGNDWERQLYVDAAPGVEVRVAPVTEAAEAYAAEAATPRGAFLLVRDLATARRLVEAGAAVPAFNVGGLHYAPGKDKVAEYVYLDDADRADARALLARGIALEVRDVPASKPVPLESLDPAVRP
jgi:mannose/fructose/N-acetylgalactosamine-specific phosphotransferase system component IIB